MTPIRKGTATRLGLTRSTYLVLARIIGTPRGDLRAVVTDRGRRSFVIDQRGSAVHNSGVTITSGMVRDTGGWRRMDRYVP